MSNLYGKRFKRILEQSFDDAAFQSGPGEEDAAFNASLDPGTDPNEFDTEGGDISSEVAAAASKNSEMMHTKLTSWISEIEDFTQFLNGLDDASMQSQLKRSVSDTVFDKIRSSEMKKIARVAMEASSLSEILKGYLASADDPKYKYV